MELEVDLSTRRQLLDLVVLRRREGPPPAELPDGFELADFNLLTFKSLHEPLTAWAVKELIGHYVNYRKQIGPSMNELLPEEQFRLFAVCTRFPEQFSSQQPLDEVQPGVYDIQWGTDRMRAIVLSRIPPAAHNAMLNLFSGQPADIHYGAGQFRQRSAETSSLISSSTTRSRASRCRTRWKSSCASSPPICSPSCRRKNV